MTEFKVLKRTRTCVCCLAILMPSVAHDSHDAVICIFSSNTVIHPTNMGGRKRACE